MIRPDALSLSQRAELLALMRCGSTEYRVARRANAMLLLDDGWTYEEVAEALYLHHTTIRDWRELYDERGIEGLKQFDAGGSSSLLTTEQEE